MYRLRIYMAAQLLLLLVLTAFSAQALEGDVTLEQALERFYAYNYDILISKYDIDKSYGDFITAKLRPNPNFSFNYIGLSPKDGSTDNSQLTARLDQLIELGGKRRLRTEYAKQTLEAAKLTHDDVIRTVLIGFYTSFFTLNLDRLDLMLAQDELKRYDRILVIGNKRYGAGFLTAIDFTKLKLGRVDLETSLATTQNQYNNDLDQFSALLGEEKPLRSVMLQVNEAYTEYGEENLLAIAYENRFDLLSLQKQLEAAKHNVSLSKALAIPDITVGAEYDSFAPKYDSTVGFGFSIPFPVFDRNQGDIYRKSAEYRQIAVQIDKTRRQVVSDIRQALNNYSSSYEIFASYKDKKIEIDSLFANTEKAFSMGGITVLDLIDTEKMHAGFMKEYNKALTNFNLNRDLIKLYTGEMK